MAAFSDSLFLMFNPAVLASVEAKANEQFDPVLVIRAIINGLNFGSIYALVALGIVLIYKSSDVVNFGHGEMGMFSTFVCFALFGALLPPRKTNEQLPETIGVGIFILGLLGALVFAALLGLVIERVLLRPLSKASVLSQVMVTIGLGVFLYGLASLVWKADLKTFPVADVVADADLRFTSGTQVIKIDGQVITALLIGGLASLLLYIFFRRTLVGTAIRAMAQNPGAAKLMGVNVGLLTGLTWMLAMMLAVIAGVLTAGKVALSPLMMADVTVKAFTAAVLGGITSLPGAVIGGLLIGVIDNLVGTLLDDSLRGILAFVIIVLVLTIKPNGLFGKTVRKKV